METFIISGFVKEGFVFLVCIILCALLMKSRFSRRASLLTAGGFLLAAAGVNAYLLYSGYSGMYVLTQLILTAYFPMIVCLHILSAASFSKTAVTWCVGFAAYFLLEFAGKLVGTWMPGWFYDIAVQILLSAVILYVTIRWVRKPFERYILQSEEDWIAPWMPLLLCLILFSYFYHSPIDTTAFMILLLLTAAVFFVIVRAFKSAEEAFCLSQDKAELARQMDIQAQRLEKILKKQEEDRVYRHDMRHHLTALEGLLKEEDASKGRAYVRGLMERLESPGIDRYCSNEAVNAVLAHYIGLAKETGCQVDTFVSLPEKTQVQDMDLCVVFANALENALHACEKVPDKERRHIGIRAEWLQHSIAIGIDNVCTGQVVFDEEGFPLSNEGEEHGYGIKSIQAVAEKYHGFCTCSLENQIFSIKIGLFPDSEPPANLSKRVKKPARKMAHALLMVLFGSCLIINLSPVPASAAGESPIKGSLAVSVMPHIFEIGWGASGIRISHPSVEIFRGLLEKEVTQAEEESKLEVTETVIGESGREGFSASVPHVTAGDNGGSLAEGAEDMNRRMEQYVELLKEEYQKYASVKYQGYAGLDSEYQILENNEDMLSIRFDTVINAGGSGGSSRIFILDKRSGKVLEIKDLFTEGADYIEVLSSEILRQMQEQSDAGTGDYFIPGGIWRDDECFKSIDPQQQFYINDEGRLVIIFDEYQVAPGSMGCPEFVIPQECISGIRNDTSLLK